MSSTRNLTAIVLREAELFVSHCPELDIASQGKSAAEARERLQEAVELFFEVADEDEVLRRPHEAAEVSRFEVPVG